MDPGIHFETRGLLEIWWRAGIMEVGKYVSYFQKNSRKAGAPNGWAGNIDSANRPAAEANASSVATTRQTPAGCETGAAR